MPAPDLETNAEILELRERIDTLECLLAEVLFKMHGIADQIERLPRGRVLRSVRPLREHERRE